MLLASLLIASAPVLSAPPQEPLLEAKVVGRQRQRVTFFGKDPKQPSPGQVSIEFGRLRFDPTVEASAKKQKGRWPMGLDYWTTLDVNAPLQIGGKKVKPGHYYLLGERRGGKIKVVFVESKKLRKKLTSFAAASTVKGGVAIPLKAMKVKGKDRHFAAVMGRPDPKGAPKKLAFNLFWGKHRHTATASLKGLGSAVGFAQSEKRSRSLLYPKAQGDKLPIATVEHSLIEWKDKHEGMLEKVEPGTRWRFGQNFWPSLETNTKLVVGKQNVSPGLYYMALERRSEDKWSLVLLDAEKVRKKTMDAFQASSTKDGIVVPLATQQEPEKTAKKLSVRMLPGAGDAATLDIRWGPHHLTVPMRMPLPKQ